MHEHSVEVQLLGDKVTLKSRGDTEVSREVVEVVSKKLRDAEKRVRASTPAHHIALLALLDLGEDYVYARKRAGEHKEILEKKSEELCNLVDAEFE